MKNLKLNLLADSELSKREMSHFIGGRDYDLCGCGCIWEGRGGSSTWDNGSANSRIPTSTAGGADVWKIVVKNIRTEATTN